MIPVRQSLSSMGGLVSRESEPASSQMSTLTGSLRRTTV